MSFATTVLLQAASDATADWSAERHAAESRQLDFEDQEYWEGSGEDLDMHEDDDEVDMRTQEELMMQHRYMMVSSLQNLRTAGLLPTD